MGKASIRKERQRLLDEMEKLDPESKEYEIRMNRLKTIAEAEASEKGWKFPAACGIAQTLISGAMSTFNVFRVLKHEDQGNIVNTKSLGYAPKPKEYPINVRKK